MEYPQYSNSYIVLLYTNIVITLDKDQQEYQAIYSAVRYFSHSSH